VRGRQRSSLDGDAGAVVDYERGCSGKGRKAAPGRHMTNIRSKQATANKKSDGERRIPISTVWFRMIT
jgi:hypothetical protein